MAKMPKFYFYCVNAEGRFAFGKQIEADDLTAAIRTASAECRAHPAAPFQGMEVWQGARCLFSSESLLRTTRLRNRRDRRRGSDAGALPRNPNTLSQRSNRVVCHPDQGSTRPGRFECPRPAAQ